MAEKGESTEAKEMSEGRGGTMSDIANPDEERKKNRRTQSHSHGQRRYYQRHYNPRYEKTGDERGSDVKQNQDSGSSDIPYHYYHGAHQGRTRGRRNRGRGNNGGRNETETRTEETGGSMEGKRRGERDHDERTGSENDKKEVGRRNVGRRVHICHETGDEGRGEKERRRRWRRGEEQKERQREHQTEQRTDRDSNESSCIDISVKERTKNNKETSDDCKETDRDISREYEGRKDTTDTTVHIESVRRREIAEEEGIQHTYTARNRGRKMIDKDQEYYDDRSKSNASRHSRDKEQRKYNRDSYHRQWHSNDRNKESTRTYSRKNNKTDEAASITEETVTVDLKVAVVDDLKMAASNDLRMSKKDVSSTQSHELSQQLLGGVYDCSVCCDRLKYYQEVWSCGTCYNIFHLRCIRRWAHSSTAAASEDNPENGWRCPCCQTVSLIIPSVYKCYCGQVNNPGQLRRKSDLLVPHSCGERCGRRLAKSSEMMCHHKCQQLCHPGPCPPCPVMVYRTCPCGKESSYVRCSQYDVLPSCDNVCDKMLNCRRHRCTDICHTGPCPKCGVSVVEGCYCERDSRSLSCGDDLCGYSCGKLCNRPLSCGNHTCEIPCHPDDCSPCSLLPSAVSHCPCGATPISMLLPEGVARTSCLDDVPVCDKVCSKPLPCSSYNEESTHLCQSRCHTGPCPSCSLTTIAVCSCGRSQIKVPCHQISDKEGFLCNKNCRKKLNCSRHHCNIKCCTSGSHICERVCGRKHDCGRHTCKDTCHPGMCGPCWNISYEELTCHCGGEVLLPPIPCGTEPPTCTRSCARIHPCNHPVTHTCHNDDSCPPCIFLTDRTCMGDHTTRQNIPCYLKDVSCGRPCGRALSCGMHTCRKTCHKGPCEEGMERCRQPCTRGREFCDHVCGQPCHIGSHCPDSPCKTKISIECHCGRLKAQVMCLASATSTTSQAFHKLYGGNIGTLMREIQSGQCIKVDSITLKNVQERKLDCDEECAQMERNRKLAEALELDVDHTPHTPPQYSSFLLDQAKFDPSLVSHVEETFRNLIESFKASTGQAAMSHHFKPMKRDQRRLIHELAEVYQLSSLSYDSEPKRNVVVMATKKSTLPYMALNQMTSRVKTMMPPPLPLKLRREDDDTKTTDSVIHVPDYFNDSNV